MDGVGIFIQTVIKVESNKWNRSWNIEFKYLLKPTQSDSTALRR